MLSYRITYESERSPNFRRQPTKIIAEASVHRLQIITCVKFDDGEVIEKEVVILPIFISFTVALCKILMVVSFFGPIFVILRCLQIVNGRGEEY